MSKLLAIACAVAGTACAVARTASADPVPAQSPPACGGPQGPVILEVARIKAGTPEQRQVTAIFENQAWSTNETPPLAGCVPPDDFHHLAADLAKAPWSVTHLRIKCMAMSPIHTEYRYKGKLVWSARMCSGEELDKASAAVVDEIDRLVDKLDPSRPKLN